MHNFLLKHQLSFNFDPTPFFALLVLLNLCSCATFKPQQVKEGVFNDSNKQVDHTFYIAGGFGNGGKNDTGMLQALKEATKKSGENSTIIFTGDNVTNIDGVLSEDESYLDAQLEAVKGFGGNVIFLPGSNEWKSADTKRIEHYEKYIKDQDFKGVKPFPENVCPIEHKVINDNLDLILIDSRWFIADWNRTKNINKKCEDIITRRRFAEELEGYINDGQGKNIVIAMHHPIFSNGKYNGFKTFGQYFLPIPFLSPIIEEISDLAAFSPSQLSNRRYNQFRILLSSLAQKSERIVFVSGHEESLQYLAGGGVQQIISGSLGSRTATKRSKDEITAVGGGLSYKGVYTHGAKGFAKLTFYEDGSSGVQFLTADASGSDQFKILPDLPHQNKYDSLNRVFPKTVKTAVLEDPSKLYKSKTYEFWWGKRFRSYYGKKVSAPVADLDTLFGGLSVMKKGGGHQSYSLRLVTKNGKEYAMRSLKKNALKFLKYKVRGIAYTEDDFKGTWVEKVVSDFFTTSHPYMQLVIDPLAKAADVNHAKTSLYYVPKQDALGIYNSVYGDELYYIEERPSDEQNKFKGYRRTLPKKAGEIPDFESTTDVLEKIKSDESYTIDQLSFLRARIFDMLIGDWDRHEDQWRWAEYDLDKSDKKIFLPIPRDRDAAFSKFDGVAIPLIQLFVPSTRFWQSYNDDLKSTKWFNAEGNNLDRMLLNKYDTDVWLSEANFIKKI